MGANLDSRQRLQLPVLARAKILGAFTFQEQNHFVVFWMKLECPIQRTASSRVTASTFGTCVKISSMIQEGFYNIFISSSYGLLRIVKGRRVSENKNNQQYLKHSRVQETQLTWRGIHPLTSLWFTLASSFFSTLTRRSGSLNIAAEWTSFDPAAILLPFMILYPFRLLRRQFLSSSDPVDKHATKRTMRTNKSYPPHVKPRETTTYQVRHSLGGLDWS